MGEACFSFDTDVEMNDNTFFFYIYISSYLLVDDEAPFGVEQQPMCLVCRVGHSLEPHFMQLISTASPRPPPLLLFFLVTSSKRPPLFSLLLNFG